MKTATLTRTETGDTGTFGFLEIDGQRWATGELPDRGNAEGISSIPAGTYLCQWAWSPKFKRNVYHVQDVPGRTAIEIHPANWMGDASKGLKCELNGCIALGKTRAVISGQLGVASSVTAVGEFESFLGGEDFELTVVDEYLEAGAPNGKSIV